MENIHKNLKFVGLVAKSAEGIEKIVNYFARKNIGVLFIKGHFETGFKTHEISEILLKTNVIISCGGDGTLISISRRLALKNAYIIGIYAGNLGFLTDVKLDECEKFFDEFLNGNYEIKRPLMLEISFDNGEKCENFVAFNDVVLSRETAAPMAKIDGYLNDKFFNTYLGDGIIVSSAMGSTAYNMSANGPIIYPMSSVFCVTPICPHSLTQRPLILPKKYVVSFKNNSPRRIVCTIDGQDVRNLEVGETIHIKISYIRTNLIRRKDADYFDILRMKLNWGFDGGRV